VLTDFIGQDAVAAWLPRRAVVLVLIARALFVAWEENCFHAVVLAAQVALQRIRAKTSEPRVQTFLLTTITELKQREVHECVRQRQNVYVRD